MNSQKIHSFCRLAMTTKDYTRFIELFKQYEKDMIEASELNKCFCGELKPANKEQCEKCESETWLEAEERIYRSKPDLYYRPK